jgi:DNA repair ATPase RecN
MEKAWDEIVAESVANLGDVALRDMDPEEADAIAAYDRSILAAAARMQELEKRAEEAEQAYADVVRSFDDAADRAEKAEAALRAQLARVEDTEAIAKIWHDRIMMHVPYESKSEEDKEVWRNDARAVQRFVKEGK